MEKEDILKRILFLNPNLNSAIDDLKPEEINSFINHMSTDMRYSIYNWELIYKFNEQK